MVVVVEPGLLLDPVRIRSEACAAPILLGDGCREVKPGLVYERFALSVVVEGRYKIISSSKLQKIEQVS